MNGLERPGRAERTEAKEYQVFKETQEMQNVSRVSFKWTNGGEEVSGGEVGTGLWGDPWVCHGNTLHSSCRPWRVLAMDFFFFFNFKKLTVM